MMLKTPWRRSPSRGAAQLRRPGWGERGRAAAAQLPAAALPPLPGALSSSHPGRLIAPGPRLRRSEEEHRATNPEAEVQLLSGALAVPDTTIITNEEVKR